MRIATAKPIHAHPHPAHPVFIPLFLFFLFLCSCVEWGSATRSVSSASGEQDLSATPAAMATAVAVAVAVSASVASTFGQQHSPYGCSRNRRCDDGSWWRRSWASASDNHGGGCDRGRGDHGGGRVGAWRWRRSNDEARRTADWLEALATDLGRLIPEVSLATVKGEGGEPVVGADFDALVQVTVWDLFT